ncbi:MAG: outer membrane beta-barrel protein [Verrucomicrobia bacterium]|nr:outer membrane beta-barrel protein [Verrucomicrobiota bacterium]
MNKVIASTGLFVLGASGLQAQSYIAPSFDAATDAKPWSIGAVVRGFYDDNSLNSNSNEIESFGIEFGPHLAYDTTFNNGATTLTTQYDYRYRWFENEARNKDDQYHIFGVSLDHKFSDNATLTVNESFVATNEPTILDEDVITAVRLRQDAIRNTFGTRFENRLSDTIFVGVDYSNRYYNYEENVFSSLLDRMEHLIGIDGRKVLSPETSVVLGYQYGHISYDGGQIQRVGLAPINSDVRNANSHYLFTGVDHAFNPNLFASLRAGAQIVDYPNTIGGDSSTTSPYIDANLTYNFAEGSSVFGVRHARNATDVSGGTNAPVLDQETTTLYGLLRYNITPVIVATVNGQAQFSSFNGGGFNDASENLYVIGATLGYRINPNILAEIGYSYTDLINDDIAGREFSRNIAFLGVTATY